MTVAFNHEQTAVELARRLDHVADQARKLAGDMQAAVDALDGLVDSARRLRERLDRMAA